MSTTDLMNFNRLIVKRYSEKELVDDTAMNPYNNINMFIRDMEYFNPHKNRMISVAYIYIYNIWCLLVPIFVSK